MLPDNSQTLRNSPCIRASVVIVLRCGDAESVRVWYNRRSVPRVEGRPAW